MKKLIAAALAIVAICATISYAGNQFESFANDVKDAGHVGFVGSAYNSGND